MLTHLSFCWVLWDMFGSFIGDRHDFEGMIVNGDCTSISTWLSCQVGGKTLTLWVLNNIPLDGNTKSLFSQCLIQLYRKCRQLHGLRKILWSEFSHVSFCVVIQKVASKCVFCLWLSHSTSKAYWEMLLSNPFKRDNAQGEQKKHAHCWDAGMFYREIS